MAVGEAAGAAARKVVSSGARKKSDEPEVEAAPLVKEADPELERLLAEEEEIERRTRQGQHHETPKFHGDED
jgi:small subunit ribosomal protein S3